MSEIGQHLVPIVLMDEQAGELWVNELYTLSRNMKRYLYKLPIMKICKQITWKVLCIFYVLRLSEMAFQNDCEDP